MGGVKLSSADKAAVVLLSLGEELASEILSHMNPTEVSRIAAAMSRLGRVDGAVAQMVAGEFHQTLVNFKPSLQGDAATTQRLLRLAGRGNDANGILSEAETVSAELAQLLEAMTPTVLAAWLRTEVPQTIAVVLAHCAPAVAGKALMLMPQTLHVEVMHRLAKLGPVDTDSLRAIIESLRLNKGRGSPTETQALGGVNKLVGLLNAMPQAESESLLAEIERRDPGLAAEVRRQMFTFADLVRINDRDMQTFLAQVPAAALRLALKQADDGVSQHIYKNLSERAAKLLREDVAAMPKSRLADVQAAQQQLAELAQAMATQGKISIMSKDEVYV